VEEATAVPVPDLAAGLFSAVEKIKAYANVLSNMQEPETLHQKWCSEVDQQPKRGASSFVLAESNSAPRSQHCARADRGHKVTDESLACLDSGRSQVESVRLAKLAIGRAHVAIGRAKSVNDPLQTDRAPPSEFAVSTARSANDRQLRHSRRASRMAIGRARSVNDHALVPLVRHRRCALGRHGTRSASPRASVVERPVVNLPARGDTDPSPERPSSVERKVLLAQQESGSMQHGLLQGLAPKQLSRQIGDPWNADDVPDLLPFQPWEPPTKHLSGIPVQETGRPSTSGVEDINFNEQESLKPTREQLQSELDAVKAELEELATEIELHRPTTLQEHLEEHDAFAALLVANSVSQTAVDWIRASRCVLGGVATPELVPDKNDATSDATHPMLVKRPSASSVPETGLAAGRFQAHFSDIEVARPDADVESREAQETDEEQEECDHLESGSQERRPSASESPGDESLPTRTDICTSPVYPRTRLRTGWTDDVNQKHLREGIGPRGISTRETPQNRCLSCPVFFSEADAQSAVRSTDSRSSWSEVATPHKVHETELEVQPMEKVKLAGPSNVSSASEETQCESIRRRIVSFEPEPETSTFEADAETSESEFARCATDNISVDEEAPRKGAGRRAMSESGTPWKDVVKCDVTSSDFGTLEGDTLPREGVARSFASCVCEDECVSQTDVTRFPESSSSDDTVSTREGARCSNVSVDFSLAVDGPSSRERAILTDVLTETEMRECVGCESTLGEGARDDSIARTDETSRDARRSAVSFGAEVAIKPRELGSAAAKSPDKDLKATPSAMEMEVAPMGSQDEVFRFRNYAAQRATLLLQQMDDLRIREDVQRAMRRAAFEEQLCHGALPEEQDPDLAVR